MTTTNTSIRRLNHLEVVRLSTFNQHKEPEVIFDFANDWHCALKLKAGMSKKEVADALIDLGNLIYRRSCDEEPKPVRMPTRDYQDDYNGGA